MKNFRELKIYCKVIFYLINLILILLVNLNCTKERINIVSTKIETIITDYHTIYTDTIWVFLEPTPCNDNSFNFGVKYFDKKFNKVHEFSILYYGYKRQNSPVNRLPICSNFTLEEKRNFTPYFSGSGFYFENDVPSTFYSLDTNKVNIFNVDFDNRLQHRIKFDLNLIKTIGPDNTLGPGIDSFHIIAPEFLVKVWFWK